MRLRRHLALPHRAVGEHRLAGDVADRVDVRVGGAAALVDLDEAAALGQPRPGSPRARGRRSARGGPPRRARGRTSRASWPSSARLDAAAGLAQRGHPRAAGGPPRTASRTPARSGWTRSRSTPGRRPVGHLDERHLAAERRVHRAQLEADVAAADHQQPRRDLRRARARAVESITRSLRSSTPGSGARRASRWRRWRA